MSCAGNKKCREFVLTVITRRVSWNGIEGI